MQQFIDESGLDGLRVCVALGMFDGVHLGHASLLGVCVDKANEYGVLPAVYTYSNSPHSKRQIERGGFLTAIDEKLTLCESFGVKAAVVRRFTPEYRLMTPEAFVDLLFSKNRVSALICGSTYRFGLCGKGDAAYLAQRGKKAGVEVICVDEVRWRDVPISSTRIRKALLNGDVEGASTMLGRPYAIPARFDDGTFVWPHRARVGAGRYACALNGDALEVVVAENGVVTAVGRMGKSAGNLAFIRKIDGGV